MNLEFVILHLYFEFYEFQFHYLLYVHLLYEIIYSNKKGKLMFLFVSIGSISENIKMVSKIVKTVSAPTYITFYFGTMMSKVENE